MWVAPLAQRLEQKILKLLVVGSIPTWGADREIIKDMRIFNIPKIETKTPKTELSKSEDFVTEVVGNPKRIHFNTSGGISLPQKSLSPYMEDVLNRSPVSVREERRLKAVKEINRPTSTVSRFVMALHNAFAEHVPFTLSPEVIMMIMSQEVAQYVKDHSTEANVASLFTKTPNEKQKINVEVNHFIYENENPWLEGVVQFRDKLIETVPSSVLEYMLPKFSNTSLETEVAHLVSFMDAASKYYEYSMSTLCGIPSFKVEESADDWDKMILSSNKLAELIPGLKDYFNNLTPVLREIRNVADGNKVDNEYWSSIYKENNGSGGPHSNGWFTNFFAHIYYQNWQTKEKKVDLKTEKSYWTGRGPGHGFKLNMFPSNISNVPFIWNYYSKEIPMSFVAGISSVEMNEGFLTPKLGVLILERNE